MSTTVQDTSSTLTLRLEGDVDLVRDAELLGLVQRLRASACTSVAIDVADVTFIDSSGFRHLIAMAAVANSRGGTLVLHQPARPVCRVLDILGLCDLVHVSTKPLGASPPVP